MRATPASPPPQPPVEPEPVTLTTLLAETRQSRAEALAHYREAARESLGSSEATAKMARHTSHSGSMRAVHPGTPAARSTSSAEAGRRVPG